MMRGKIQCSQIVPLTANVELMRMGLYNYDLCLFENRVPGNSLVFINLQKCMFFFRVVPFSDKPIWRIVILSCTCCSGFFLAPYNLAINVYAPKHRYKSCMMGGRPKKQVLIVGWELSVAHETATFQNIALSFLGFKDARPFQNA